MALGSEKRKESHGVTCQAALTLHTNGVASMGGSTLVNCLLHTGTAAYSITWMPGQDVSSNLCYHFDVGFGDLGSGSLVFKAGS